MPLMSNVSRLMSQALPPSSPSPQGVAKAHKRQPKAEFLFGLALGSSLAYLLFVGIGLCGLSASWQPGELTFFALMVALFHERFWLSFTSADPGERPYQLGTVAGAAAILVLWYVQFH
jgi:hypothetical protein